MAAMLHARNNTILFLWDKMFILMQNIFIVPGMQHGRHAKPLFRALGTKSQQNARPLTYVKLRYSGNPPLLYARKASTFHAHSRTQKNA